MKWRVKLTNPTHIHVHTHANTTKLSYKVNKSIRKAADSLIWQQSIEDTPPKHKDF